MVWIRDALAESPRRTAGWLAMQQLVRNVVETDKEISCSREREAYVGRVYHMEQDEERERGNSHLLYLCCCLDFVAVVGCTAFRFDRMNTDTSSAGFAIRNDFLKSDSTVSIAWNAVITATVTGRFV